MSTSVAVVDVPKESSELPVHVLIVDDQEVVRELCSEIADALGYRVSVATNGEKALEVLEREHVDVLMADLKMPGMNGMELLEKVKSRSQQTEVLIMTAYGSVPSAVQAMKLGACDYLTKPFNIEEVKLLLERIVHKADLISENRLLREQVRFRNGYGELLGTAPSMQKLFKMIVKVSESHYPVLIVGESGTGKELVARAIHQSGPLREKPFLPVDCSALVPTLIESELFGYVRGAFTGGLAHQAGIAGSSPGRHCLSGRDRRNAGGPAVQASAGPAGTRSQASGQHARSEVRCPHHRRQQPRSGIGYSRGRLSQGPLFSS